MWKNFLRIAVLAVSVGTTGWLLADDHGNRTIQKSMPSLDNPLWRAECGSCHGAYHPGLLPERSWRALMGKLDDHFGENAALDAATQRTITDFLVAHAADRGESRRSAKITQSIANGETPTRISTLNWFVRKHHEVSPATWKRPAIGSAANCTACHPGAEKGDFSERAIRIPRA